MTPVKRTVWPLRAIFDTFACFFTQVDQIGPRFSVRIVKLRQNLLAHKQNHPKNTFVL